MSPKGSDSYDLLVVGAGYAGSVIAERYATQCEARVLVIDRRDHIAGNAYDYVDEHGVLVHRYGPHIFHTNARPIVDYLSGFTEWHPYEHRVVARVDGQLLPMPINRDTVNRLYGLDLRSEQDVEAFYAERREEVEFVRTSEDAVVAKVGRDLYEKFFRGYTRKQWERDPSELHASVCARIPIRTNTDDRYFTDWHQAMPVDGYTAMFERILDHPLIDVSVNTDFDDVQDEVDHAHLVYTGPIDKFFDFRFGQLPYRSLEFDLRNQPTPDGGLVQPTGSINEPRQDVPHTRTTEFRHMTGQSPHGSSTIAYEYPRTEGDPYYPIPRDDTRALYKQYEALGEELPDVTFVGRLARYQYLNMDQVVGQALSTFERMLERGVGR
ncbi:MAG: UDP-galactopyranose mutase, partial [Thermoleophilaceae bacterium]|nr:UDP-galactopyranose mutase [Thermoleophilaceae bacterium]